MTTDKVQTYSLNTLYGFCFMTVSEDVVRSWNRTSFAIDKKVTKLEGVVCHLESKCNAVNNRTLDLQKDPYIKTRDNEILASL